MAPQGGGRRLAQQRGGWSRGDSEDGGTRMALMRSTVAFSAMTLLSRIAGLARDMLQAALFGAGVAADAFVIAYRIPNFLRRIFAEGSFSQAFVPVLAELKASGDPRALKDFVDHVAGALCAAALLVTALGIAAAPLIVWAIAPGTLEDAVKHALTTDLLRVTFPYLLFISLTSLAAGVLNSFRRFALPAATPILHNLSLIAAMLLLVPLVEPPIMALAWGVFAAGALQLLMLWPALAKHGLLPRPRLAWHHPGMRRVFKLMLPTIFSSSVAQVNLVVGTAFASLLATGSQVWLYMAERLSEFPLGLFAVAVATVILPHLSGRHAATDAEGFSRSLDWALRLVLLLALPAAVGLALLALPLTTTIFQYGRFGADDARMAALALLVMSGGVPFFMASKVLAPAFYARQDTRTPMRIALATVGLNIVLTVLIVTPLWLEDVRGAHAGIALSTSLAGALNALLLWRTLRRRGLYIAQPGWSRWLGRIVLGCAAMAAVVWALARWVGPWDPLPASERIGWLLATVGAGGLTYLATVFATGLRPRHLRDG